MAEEGGSTGDSFPERCEIIEVRVPELRRLFNAIDPSPLHERDLDPDAEEFIVGWARNVAAGARHGSSATRSTSSSAGGRPHRDGEIPGELRRSLDRPQRISGDRRQPRIADAIVPRKYGRSRDSCRSDDDAVRGISVKGVGKCCYLGCYRRGDRQSANEGWGSRALEPISQRQVELDPS